MFFVEAVLLCLYFDVKDYFLLYGGLDVGLGWYVRTIFKYRLFLKIGNSLQTFNNLFFAHLLEYFKNDYILSN
jgi:hypothetical protein